MGQKGTVLFYGYGNPGRQDDGLGNRFIEMLESWAAANKVDWIETESNYQLNIEDAMNIKDKDLVVFVDASTEELNGFTVSRVEPDEGKAEFTLHAASPAFVVALCLKVFEKAPPSYLIHIRGYEWEFKEGLSPEAEKNLKKTFLSVVQVMDKDKSLKTYLDSVAESGDIKTK